MMRRRREGRGYSLSLFFWVGRRCNRGLSPTRPARYGWREKRPTDGRPGDDGSKRKSISIINPFRTINNRKEMSI